MVRANMWLALVTAPQDNVTMNGLHPPRLPRVSPGATTPPHPCDPSRPLFFMHIPKTAGTAITAALAATSSPRAVVAAFDHCLFGGFRAFETMSRPLQETIFAAAEQVPPDRDFIAGHFALSTLQAVSRNAQIMTVLREPCSRLLSHWQFWRQHTDDMLAGLGDWAPYVRLSRKPLVGFLGEERIACQTDNLATRMLLWPHPLIPVDGFIDPANDPAILQAASARLDELDFVDFVENPDFIANLQAWLGRELTVSRAMETSFMPLEFRAPLHDAFSAEAYALLVERSRLDLRLWTLIASHHLSAPSAGALRERSLLANVARYAALNVSPAAPASIA